MNKWIVRPIAAAVAASFASSPVMANPTGAQVVGGTVSMARPDAKTLNVTNSPGSIINWQGFSIGAGEITRFIQQSSSSAVLNRVVGADISQIAGQLLSNGRVFLINPAGIVIGGGAVIDTAGFVASTLNMKDADFLAGKLRFDGDATAGSIVNQGWIKASSGGNVILVAPNVTNSGVIQTDGGQIILAAGQKLTIGSLEHEGVQFEVQAPTDGALNIGKLLADGGAVGVFAGTLKHTGDIRASALTRDAGGLIVLKAQGDVTIASGSTTAADGKTGGNITIQSETGTTLVSGNVSAKGSEGKGGDIRVLGERVGIIESAVIDASGKYGGGQILIGGDYRGQNALVQNAARTYFGPAAALRADANTSGDGGRIIVWSNEATRVYGAITARGGAQSGNGGFVETSGHYLDVFSNPDVSARNGRGGTWLLDPFNITITANTTSPDNPGSPNFTPGADESQVSADQIRLRLEANSTVIIDTGGAGVGGADGNITVTNAGGITTTGGAGATLFLNADGTVNLNGVINVAEHNVSITAGRGAAGPGGIHMNGVPGNVVIQTGNGASSAGNVTLNAMRGNIVFNQNLGPAITAAASTAASDGNVTLLAPQGSILNNRTNQVAVGRVNTLTINADQAMTSNNGNPIFDQFATSVRAVGVTTATGDFIINNDQALIVNASTATAGLLSFTGAANSLMTVAGAVSAGTRARFQTDAISIPAGGSIAAPIVDIFQRTNTIPIQFTNAADVVGTNMRLDNNELARITRPAGLELRVGLSNGGDITFQQAVDVSANITGPLTLLSGGAISQDAGAAITANSLALDGGSVSLIRDNVVTGTVAGRSTAGAFSFNNAQALGVGSLNTFQNYVGITASGGAVTITSDGTLTVGSAVNSGGNGTTSLATTAGNIVLNAAVGNATTATTLASAGTITGSGTVSGTDVLIQSGFGIGVDATDRVNTAATSLTARTTTSGGVFISEANDVSLITAPGFAPIPNEAATGGAYNVTAAGTITVDGGVNIGQTGLTTLITTGANTRNIVLNASVGNGSNSTVLRSAGNITRTAGTVTGTDVTLDSATGVGVAGTRVNTSAATLMARSTASGGVFVSEADGVTLDTLGGLNNGVALGNSAYDVTAAGTIAVSGVVNTSGTGTGTTTLTSTGAGNNIALGNNVGKSTAATVLTSAGNITRTAGTVTGTDVSLDSATGVGGALARVSTTATTLMARATTSGDVFVSETDGVTLDRINTFDSGTVGVGAFNVTAAGTLNVAGAVTAAGTGAVTLATSGNNNITLGAAGVVTGGTITANAPGGSITDGGTAGRFDTSANNGDVTLSAASIGVAAAHGGVNVSPGNGTVTATATTGSIYLERAGAAQTEQYNFNVQTAGQTAGLEASGNIDVSADLNLAGRNVVLTTNGAAGANNVTFANNITVTASNFTVNTTAGALADFTGSTVTLNTPVTIGANATTVVDGPANVIANGTTSVNGPLTWSDGTISGTGTVTVAGTTTVTGGTPQISGTFSTGVLNQTDGIFSIANTGTLNITGPGPSQITGGTLSNNGTFNLRAGRFNAGVGFQPNNGILQLDRGTTFSATANVTNNRGGTIAGNGTLDLFNKQTLINNGILAPGASPGTFAVLGNYTQGPGGTLLLELGGLSQGVTYDLLQVTGTANLAGTLTATNVNGFSPSGSDVFDVMTFGGRNGDFSTFNLPTGLIPIAGVSEYRLALAGSTPGLDSGFISAEEGRRQLPTEELQQPLLGPYLCQ